MGSAICTLFEGSYHVGLAALTNSLCRQGYTGTIYAGYRGPLPPWALGSDEAASQASPIEYRVNNDVQIRFLQVATSNHLTNYKPDFMLRLLEEDAVQDEGLFYFDPDLTVATRWSFFEKWTKGGVALCEDVNSPLARNHPRRVAWRDFFRLHGFSLGFREETYVNGGCVGIRRENLLFVETWRDLQIAMAKEIGGLSSSKLGGGTSEQMRDPHFHFSASDQDALNATVEVLPKVPLAILGSDAMGFRSGCAILPHALGVPKPWNKQYLREALGGHPPTLADKGFWSSVDGCIKPLRKTEVFWGKLSMRTASLLGRFYRRS